MPDVIEARLHELEPTRREPTAAPAAGAIEGFEPTRIDHADRGTAGDEPPRHGRETAGDEPSAWIERTAREPAAPTAVEPLALERTGYPSPQAPARDLLAAPVCRYCRTPASPGESFCPRCGLKLAVYSRETAVPEAERRRCRFCGFVASGPTCPACGAGFAGGG